jgi:hypothetical protein
LLYLRDEKYTFFLLLLRLDYSSRMGRVRLVIYQLPLARLASGKTLSPVSSSAPASCTASHGGSGDGGRSSHGWRLVDDGKDNALPLSFLSSHFFHLPTCWGIRNRVHRTQNHAIVVARRVRFGRLTAKPRKPFSSILPFISQLSPSIFRRQKSS